MEYLKHREAKEELENDFSQSIRQIQFPGG
jgi:hypothetical protein